MSEMRNLFTTFSILLILLAGKVVESPAAWFIAHQ